MGVIAGLLTACTPRTVVKEPVTPAGGPFDPSATEGAALYTEHCAACHGGRGEGQPEWKVPGPDGALPAPPHDSSGHTWHHPDAVLLQIIAEGGTLYTPDSKMPGFAATLTPHQMTTVLTHIKTWWGADEGAYQADRTAESDAAAAAGDS